MQQPCKRELRSRGAMLLCRSIERATRTREFAGCDREPRDEAQVVFGAVVDDIFVLTAWAKESKADGKIEMLADGSAEFAKKVGLEVDLTARGLGVRSKRYSMIVEDGVLKSLNIDETPGVHDMSSATKLCSLA